MPSDKNRDGWKEDLILYGTFAAIFRENVDAKKKKKGGLRPNIFMNER